MKVNKKLIVPLVVIGAAVASFSLWPANNPQSKAITPTKVQINTATKAPQTVVQTPVATESQAAPAQTPAAPPPSTCTADDQNALNIYRSDYANFKQYLIDNNKSLIYSRTNGGMTLDMMQSNVDDEVAKGCQ